MQTEYTGRQVVRHFFRTDPDTITSERYDERLDEKAYGSNS